MVWRVGVSSLTLPRQTRIIASMRARILAVLAIALAVACGSPSPEPEAPTPPVAEPPAPPKPQWPPPWWPPKPPPPPPVTIVDDVRVAVVLETTGLPMVGCRVVLGEGLEALTDASGVALFAHLEATAYLVLLNDLPAHVVQDDPPLGTDRWTINVDPAAAAFTVDVVPTWTPGSVVLLGDSDSADRDSEGKPNDWRSTSVDDHLDELAPLLGWPSYEHENLARNCTSVEDTGCANVAMDQVRRLPDDARIAILRFGLNDLHYYGLSPDAVSNFRRGYQNVVDEVIRRGAFPVLVAIQEEEDDAYRGARAGFNAAIEGLAEDRGAYFVDPGLSWRSDRDAFANDGVHLDDDGTRIVAAAVLDTFERELTRGARVP